MNATVDIKATGEVVSQLIGPFSYFIVKKTPADFQISFDGAPWQDASQNDRFSFPTPVMRISLRCSPSNPQNATVSYIYSTAPISTQDTVANTQIVETFNVGNLNGEGNIAPGAGGYIAVPKATFTGAGVCNNLNTLLKIPGNFDGSRRKQITISTFDNSGTSCLIFDSNGNLYCFGKIGTALAWETADTFYVGGYNGAANVVIGETYYNA